MLIWFNKFQEEIKMKRSKIILVILFLSVIALIFSGCGGSGTTPNITKNGSMSGKVLVPDNFKKGNESWTYPLSDASVDTIDSEGKKHITTTDNNGYYTIFDVAPGHSYIITAEGMKKGNTIVLKDIAEEVKEGENYNAGTADAKSTTTALVLENIMEDPEVEIDNVNVDDIKNCENYNEALSVVSNTIESGNNVLTSADVSNSITSVNTANAIIEPNPSDKGKLWGYLYSKAIADDGSDLGVPITDYKPVVGGYVFAIDSTANVIGWSQTFPANYPTYRTGWWMIENLPVGEEFTLVGFHPSYTYLSAIYEYTLTEPGYQAYDANPGEYSVDSRENLNMELNTYSPPSGSSIADIIGGLLSFNPKVIVDIFILVMEQYEFSLDLHKNTYWAEIINNKLLTYINYFDNDEEKQKITEVVNKLNSAFEDLDFDKIKSCCIFNSEAYNQVVEIEEKCNELESLGNDVSIYVVEPDFSDIEITIGGIVANTSDSGSLTIYSTPLGIEEASFASSEKGKTFLEKTENGWKIYKSSITDFVTVSDTNQPPTISDLSADPPSVDIDQSTTITCIASDEDEGDTLTYTWTKNGGTFEGSTSGSTIIWKAPSTEGNYTVTCEVSDGEASDSDQVIILVGEPTSVSAPIGVSASDGTYEGKVKITWNSVSGASYYHVYRATSASGTKTPLGSWQTSNYYYDYAVNSGTTYYYFVKAATSSSGSNASDYSSYNTGYPKPPVIDPPTVQTYYMLTVDSTEADVKCGIDNTGGENASMRGVKYRDVTADGSIQSTGSPGDFGVGNWYSRMTNLTPNHQYEVRTYATNSAGTGYGKWITFHTETITLSAPTGVSASDGTYEGKVKITWNSVSGASHYHVYRATSASGTKTPLGSWQTSTYYYNSVTSGTYYYFVKAATSSSGANASDYSSYNAGYPKPPVTTFSAPAGVSASDGTYSDKVKIVWISVTGASYYRVYQANSASGTKTPLGSWQTSNYYYDYAVNPGTTYYYFVKAATSSSGSNASDYSSYNTGYPKPPDTTLSAPKGVDATDGTYSDKVYINWNVHADASYYRVYRATSSGGTKTAITNWQSNYYYYDYDVTPGIHYYYWVKAATSSSGANESPYSDYNEEGYPKPPVTTLSAPAGVSASDGTYSDKVKIVWISVTEASYYRVYQANSASGTKTPLGSWQTSTYYYDYYATPGTTYYYFVKAATSSSGANASDYSSYNTGYPSIVYGSITVTSKDSNGNLISSNGLEYVLYKEDSGGTWQDIKTVAASSNSYKFSNLSAGVYDIEVYTNGTYRGAAANISLSSGQNKSVTIIAN